MAVLVSVSTAGRLTFRNLTIGQISQVAMKILKTIGGYADHAIGRWTRKFSTSNICGVDARVNSGITVLWYRRVLTLDLNEPDSQSNGKLKTTTTAGASSKSTGRKSRVTTTSPRSIGDLSSQLTLCAEGSPVNRSPLPGSDEARLTTVTSGLKLCAALKGSGPLGRFSKMLLASPQWHSSISGLQWTAKALLKVRSETYSIVWDEVLQTKRWQLLKASDTKSSRLLFQLAVSTHRTSGSDSGFWRTPTQEDSQNREFARNSRGEPKLSAQVRYGKDAMWPTPRGCDGEKGIRTPEGAARERIRRKNGQDLPTVAGGQLNPQFVEWLMGYPIDHTDLEGSATRSSRKLRKHSGK